MNTIDIIVLVVLTYFVYKGSKAGMIEELLGITGWVIAIILALRFGGMAGEYVVGKLPLAIGISASIIGFIIVLLLVRIAFKVFSGGFKKMVSSDAQTSLDRFLGAAIGFLKGAFFVSLFALAIQSMPLGEKMQTFREESALYPHMTKFARVVVDSVVKFIPQIQSQEIPDVEIPELPETSAIFKHLQERAGDVCC
ncbi:CvpA family protein [candidate division KSB1 bacterium]|nr:CvpA family protein [candidate division KSB1 bacterium]